MHRNPCPILQVMRNSFNFINGLNSVCIIENTRRNIPSSNFDHLCVLGPFNRITITTTTSSSKIFGADQHHRAHAVILLISQTKTIFIIHAMFTQQIIFLRDPYFSLMLISNQTDSSTHTHTYNVPSAHVIMQYTSVRA